MIESEPICDCGFPLCHSYTPSDDEILYVGDLDVFCGNCGKAFAAKSVCDATSTFSTPVERQMSSELQDIAEDHVNKQRQDISRLTYRVVRPKMIKKFGMSPWWKYKKIIQRDLSRLNYTTLSPSIPRPMFTVATSEIQPRLSSYIEISPTEELEEQHPLHKDLQNHTVESSALEAATELARQLVNVDDGSGESTGGKPNGGGGSSSTSGKNSTSGSTSSTTAGSSTTTTIGGGSGGSGNKFPVSSKDLKPSTKNNSTTVVISGSTTNNILRDPSGSVRYASLEAIVSLMCDPNEDSHFDISSVVRLTYSQYCVSTDLVLIMVKTLDHFMAAENYRRQSMLISELKLLVEHLGKHSRSSDSMNALDVLEMYIQRSLEEVATSIREKKDLNMLAKSLSRVRNHSSGSAGRGSNSGGGGGATNGGAENGNAGTNRSGHSNNVPTVPPLPDTAPAILPAPPANANVTSMGSTTSQTKGAPIQSNDYQSMSPLRVLSCMTMWPPPTPTKHDPDPNLAFTASTRQIAEQLTLMIAAIYKRIQPYELVPSTRKYTGKWYRMAVSLSFLFLFCGFWLFTPCIDNTTSFSQCIFDLFVQPLCNQ